VGGAADGVVVDGTEPDERADAGLGVEDGLMGGGLVGVPPGADAGEDLLGAR
jgi:hypothetical protein